MGVYLQFGSSGSTVSGLKVSWNSTGLYGAQLSDNNRIRSNRFFQNSGDGVFLMGSAILTGNESDHNGRHGVILVAGGRVSSNRLNANAVDGLHVSASAPSQVEFNTAGANGDDGIDVNTLSGTTVRGNAANMNHQHGIVMLPLNTDGGGNTAFGNLGGNCVNVNC